MVSSMTGYSRKNTNTQFGEIQWEVRSLNHRALDVNIHLPEMFRMLESACRQQISAKLQRGRIDAYLKVSGVENNLALQQLDMRTVDALLNLSERLCESTSQLSSLSVLEVLKWPGVITPPDIEHNDLSEIILTEFAAAVDDLVADRGREGVAIQQILSDKVEQLNQYSKQVSEMTQQVQEAAKDNLRTKIEDIQVHVDPTRFEQEIALILVKSDINEEIERFALHIAEFRRVLTQEAEAGKRLGFIAQELGREINTLSSKTNYFPLNTLMVDAKVVLEQIREQLHNIA